MKQDGKKVVRVGVYLRVSTDGQTIENQRRDLEEAAAGTNWKVVKVYVDEGISGAKGRAGRPGFDALLKDATRRKLDLVAAWSVDRLGRSLQDLAGFLVELHRLGVGVYLHKQGVDTTTPSGRAMFQMLGVFAEFEAAMIRERTLTGLARARAAGVRLGRPKVAAALEQRIRELRGAGKGMLAIGRELGVGTSVVQRVVREMTAGG